MDALEVLFDAALVGVSGCVVQEGTRACAAVVGTLLPNLLRLMHREPQVAAGPIANFLLAILIFAVLISTYGQPYTTPVISQVRRSTVMFLSLSFTTTMPRKIRRLVGVLKIVGLRIRSRCPSLRA